MHILDIVQNSISAKASLISIEIYVDESKDVLTVTIEDNGTGMSEDFLKRVKSPFATSRTQRNVGLGIPLFAASCERTGMALGIESTPGVGTKLAACYRLSHIDRPPTGDIPETIQMLTLLNPNIDFVYKVRKENEFVYDTRQIKQHIGEVPITNAEVINFIKEYISEGTTEIFGGIDI